MKCLYTERCFNAFETKEFQLDIRKETSKIYCKQKSNMPVSMRRLINDGIGDKSHNNRKSVSGSGSHAFLFTHDFSSMFYFYLYSG